MEAGSDRGLELIKLSEGTDNTNDCGEDETFGSLVAKRDEFACYGSSLVHRKPSIVLWLSYFYAFFRLRRSSARVRDRNPERQ